MGKPKQYTEYINAVPDWWQGTLDDYAAAPAAAFLREAVHISDAVVHCERHFKRKSDKAFTKDSQDSLYRLAAASLAAVMGHFETFQRSLFAGVVELSRWFAPDLYNVETTIKTLQKQQALQIQRLFQYRGERAPVGHLLADALSGWHSPETVNSHFKTVLPNLNFFNTADANDLAVLWQMRHSIVHTGGWLTPADAQKHQLLTPFAGRPLLLDSQVVVTIVRRLHRTVAKAVRATGAAIDFYKPSSASRAEIDTLLDLSTPRKSWLK